SPGSSRRKAVPMKPPERLFKDQSGDGGGRNFSIRHLAMVGKDPATDYALAIGQPYPGGQRSWPEGVDFHCRDGMQELRIFLGKASRLAIRAVRCGPVEFGFFAEPPGLMLITRFDPRLSFHCLPPPSGETSSSLRILVTIILIEATTGIVRAMRG